MLRIVTLALAALAAAPAAAEPPRDQLLAAVARELPVYGFTEVDPRTLSRAQLAQIHHIMHSDRSESDKRAMIQSALGGPNTLRGLLFGN